MPQSSSERLDGTVGPRLIVVISVDWEGRSLLEENLEAIRAFRQKQSDIPFQHFLNPAYFTRNTADARSTARAIERALLPIDEHGLHVHAWQSLVVAAGVPWRGSPRFIDDSVSVPKAQDDWEYYPAEEGYDVPLETYDTAELEKILATSSELLLANGFRRPTTFRAGGWMSGARVQSALTRQGFEADCSAVDPEPAIRRFGDMPLCRLLSKMWPNIDCTSQPYSISTPAGSLWQVPNNGGLLDYVDGDDIAAMISANLEYFAEGGNSTRFFSIGFHQETARKFLDRLEPAIDFVRRAASSADLDLVFSARPQDYLPVAAASFAKTSA